MMDSLQMDSLHLEDFAAHVNTTFQMSANGQQWEIELVSATDKSPFPHQEQFILVFRGPAQGPPFQSIFNLQHAVLGAGDLFLVPIHRDANGLYYEAIFNRPR